VDRPDRRPEDRLEPLDRPPILQRQALQGTPDESPSSWGAACPFRAQKAASRAACRRGRGTSCRRVDQGGERRRCLGATDQLLVRELLPRARPSPPALLHQPEPHDVLQRRVVPATPPSFVKFERSVSAVMIGEGTSTPKATTSRAEVAPIGGTDDVDHPARRTTGTAATALAVSWVAGAMTRTLGIPTSWATDRRIAPISVPGSISSGRIALGKFIAVQSSSDQVPDLGSRSLRCRGVGPLARASARQEPRKHIRHHQERLRRLQDGRVRQLQRQELIERVEREELQPGHFIDPLAGDSMEGRLEHPSVRASR